jgi:hypothetical protein
MSEEFLQFIWKNSLFSQTGLTTTQGQPVLIINPGKLNTDAGPDFFNASVKIGDTLWAGNVEVHLRSSDWLQHGHQNDSAYNNVILHVVHENDKTITLPNGMPLPSFILPVKKEHFENYNELLSEHSWPACSRTIATIDEIFRIVAFDGLLVERLSEKTLAIEKLLNDNLNNWNETFHQLLARNFGFKTNAQPFEMLARYTPLSILAKHKKNLFQTEAILFGQSGLLNEELLGDDYFLNLREEYSFFSKKYHLKGMEGYLWKFMRLRPANFPTIRIAQFASLINQSESLLSKLIDENDLKKILAFFDVKASPYWDSHYRFSLPSPEGVKQLGEISRNNIVINTVVPFLFLYGERNNIPELKQRSLDLLEVLPSESNSIITRWGKVGIMAHSAFDSQALIQLKNNYCEPKKCLKCMLSTKVIDR